MAAGARAASLDVGSASGAPGDDVTVAVSLHTMGDTVLGTQNRIDFDRDTPVAATASGDPDCAVNPAIDKNATGFRYLPLGCDPAADCASVRVFVLSFDNLAPIADGSVLYTCRIAIAAGAQLGTHPLHNAEVGASAMGGQSVPTTGSDGAVEVALAPVASIGVGSASAAAGSSVVFSVRIALLGDPPPAIAGVQNDIAFDPSTRIAATPSGRPACTVNPAIDKDATSFSFLPMGCSPAVDCTGVRAFVLSASNTDPLPDGATLYGCQVDVDPAAALGAYPLVASMPLASGPLGQILPALATNGAIEVTAAPPPPTCVGDCDDDRAVAINELLVGVNIVTGGAALSVCPVLDANDDGSIAVNELVQAVSNALSGCPE
jgi:hypothetical protein